MKAVLKRLWKDDEGQDLVEYALLLAFISLAAASLFPAIGTAISSIFTTAQNCVTTPAGCPAAGAGPGTIILGL